ncbi:Lrp/AsnC family transcriptional regulator [Pedobacter psychrodurus]|uniref:Lrp/AsnC family transcriptional regulator n=1 Tax=Pedobacter psychrodurus TaxID=2530456 RepID=A0A4R0Q0V0_9SPHI|nr:Lrp/AsnC family transcriptional regulator [Pedobacter psychrodurus]TCD28596.1 Lrp/AsnC family transcriptional regulator [Pedobacter psychrodurus]
MESFSPDQTDFGILKLLQKDAHLTYKELAFKLHRSQTPIKERIEKLERNGYIKCYVALVDYRKVPDCMMAYLHIQLNDHSQEALSKFQEGVCNFPEVVDCCNCTGAYDFILKIITRNMNTYNEFLIHKIGKLNNVGSLNSSVVIAQIKHDTAIPF